MAMLVVMARSAVMIQRERTHFVVLEGILAAKIHAAITPMNYVVLIHKTEEFVVCQKILIAVLRMMASRRVVALVGLFVVMVEGMDAAILVILLRHLPLPMDFMLMLGEVLPVCKLI